MKQRIKRCLATVLASALCVQLMAPMSVVFAADTGTPETYTIENNYISATVSTENGGFTIRSVEGNGLKKDDNNKELLFHSGDYDTSFTSFRVTRNGATKEYLFGGDYGFLGLNSSDVTTYLGADEIRASWSVDGIQFIQTISLANSSSTEHGMVNISYNAWVESGADADIEVRVLLDTAMGNLDYAYYNIENASNGVLTDTIQQETVITAAAYGGALPSTLYATDDAALPGIVAYTVNDINSMPYQVAFGHWNNLAATLFDFVPDSGMTFTNSNNVDYLTADSACALYYDLGQIAGGDSGNMTTTYGIYSNATVASDNSIAINLVAPKSVDLSGDKTSYTQIAGALGEATFDFDVNIENVSGGELSNVALAVYTQTGLTALKQDGSAYDTAPSYDSPHYIQFYNMASGAVNDTTFQIKADVGASATYRKIEVVAFDVGGSGEIQLSQDKIIGTNSFYVLCPGGDGALPQVTFTGADPTILYYQGINHYIVKGNNFNMLEDKSNYTLYFQNVNDGNDTYTVDTDDFTINAGEGTIDIITTRDDGQDWSEKTYQLYLKWNESYTGVEDYERVYTAPALSVTFSRDEAYKLNTYGVVAVYQDKADAPNQKYYIKSFRTETEYTTFKNDTTGYGEILLEFRGSFVENPTTANNANTEGVWLATAVDDEVISINNCLDLEKGTVKVYYDGTEGADGTSVLVDLDGMLYTSVAKTGVWAGKASLTEITNGKEYALIGYSVNGARSVPSGASTITLVWPLGASIAQSLSGMLLQLGYGEFGIITDDNGKELGRVVGFTASLDIGFLIPNGSKVKGNNVDSKFARIKDAFNLGDNDYTNADLRTRAAVLVTDAELTDEEINKQTAGAATAAVTVDDVLFGCGQGFYGINFTVDVVLPSYTEQMPKIGCELSVNTINSWSFGVEGDIIFSDWAMGATIEVISYNDIPIPNSFFCYIKSTPGINVDGTGALWITGGGGGFDNLYETIICSDTLPTLQLMMRLYFEIYQVLQGQADTTFSLQGFSNVMSNVKLKETTFILVPKATFAIQWYPDFYLKSGISFSIFDIIQGGGYIVVEVPYDDPSQTFAEGYILATVHVPAKYGFAGGLELAGAELGLNVDKIWGQLSLLGFLDMGMIYYWGDADSFDFGLDVEGASPTYPELLGYSQPVPLAYDGESGQTLYMQLGTNFSVSAQAELVDDLNGAPVLFDSTILPYVKSDYARLNHTVNLGVYQNKNDVFTLSYDAVDLAEAQSLFGAMKFKCDGTDYDVICYDAKNSSNGANANLTYDPGTGRATLAVFTTSSAAFGVDWTITTPTATDIVTYDVAVLPKVSTVTAAFQQDGRLQVDWTGVDVGDLDSVSLYLTKDRTPTEDANPDDLFLGMMTDKTELEAKTATFTVEPSLASGDYYIRAVYNQENTVCGTTTSTTTVNFQNVNMPSAVTINSVQNGGDYQFDVSLSADTADGYLIDILNADGSDSDITGVSVAKTADSQIASVGGSYQVSDEQPITDSAGNIVYNSDGSISYTNTGAYTTLGLTGGARYIIQVQPYRDVDTDGDGVADYSVYGAAVQSASIQLATPSPSKIDVTSQDSHQTLSYASNSGTPASYDTFGMSAFTLTATADTGEGISGSWSVDTGYDNQVSGMYGDFTAENSVDIDLSDLQDGTHQLKIWGEDESGDAYSTIYPFVVDTVAPSLQMSAPLNGSVYDESTGRVDIVGMTDSEAILTLTVDGVAVSTGNISWDVNTGEFTLPVYLNTKVAQQTIALTASDQLGNSTNYTSTLTNSGLGNIESLDIYVDGRSIASSESHLSSDVSFTSTLSLIAITADGNAIDTKNSGLVNWSCTAVEGDATIAPDGTLNVQAGSDGFVQGALMVSSLSAMTSAICFDSDVVDTGGDSGGNTGSGSSGAVSPSDLVKTCTEDQLTQIKLPSDYETTQYLPYYYDENQNPVPVQMSMVTEDGYLVFLPPVSGRYYIQAVSDTEFSDLSDSHYAKSAIDFCVAIGLFSGTSATTFEPDSSTTRAMFVTVLWRLAGSPTAQGGLFDDVPADMWYTQAIQWANAMGVVFGYSDATFAPDDLITREQMCTIIIRYATAMGSEIGVVTDRVALTDLHTIDDYALESVTLCGQYGLVLGDETGAFSPKDPSTRGQIAIVLQRYIQAILTQRGDT